MCNARNISGQAIIFTGEIKMMIRRGEVLVTPEKVTFTPARRRS